MASESEFLDWYCWYVAQTADRFYPPDETADECIQSYDGDMDEYLEGVENGQHSRAFLDAADFFEDARARGMNPVERAKEYEAENVSVADHVDWAWLEDTHYRGDVDA